MRFAFVLRLRRGLLMQPHPSHSSPHASSSGSLKRPYAQQAQATARSPTSAMPQRAGGSLAAASADAPLERPAKTSKIDRTSAQAHFASATAHAARGRSQNSHSSSSRKDRNQRNKLPVLQGPYHDERYIREKFKNVTLKPEHDTNPKSPLSNLHVRIWDKVPTYEHKQFVSPQGKTFRSTVTVGPIEAGGQPIIGIGDAPSAKQADRIAALSALYQLSEKGLLDVARQAQVAQANQFSPLEVKLSDGSVVGFSKARQFMDYYCRRFGFGQPDVDYQSQSRGWEAVMTVGGRKIGLGSGQNKKVAMTACYADVVHYLESCDPELWKKFVADAKTGRDLGMAVPVLFEADQRVEDQLSDLCADIKKSTLYKNRPRLRSLMTGSDDPSSYDQPVPQPKYVAPYRRQADAEFLENKSKDLLNRRQRYLADPAMENMRNTREALPVYTKAAQLLDHIRTHNVTICMAATGSGKTTQIPQLILDEWIEKGEGAKCNIFCTQPRRIAAISVAQRVAAERGETAGRGTIGYHVRFEAAYPQEHGSVTFCTTGIFLKRMQASLENTGRSNMDDVTHILVDEVHERDVDTDLLLVVLKRLLADRKARGIPIKVVLMSATIDPKLFQEYFPDEQGRPASVIDIPGRSFPVTKHFMDSFLPELASQTSPSERWVFSEPPVQKYIAQELGPDLSTIPALSFMRPSARQGSSHHEEEADIPHPLIALTISHVLRKTNDGHVLVFLPGWDDIVGVQKALLTPKQPLDINFNDRSKFGIHCLHSTVPLPEQQLIFEPPPEGQRRIILATNIAETSVTIPNVVYVVDSAKVKEQRYDPERHISSLVSAWVGSSNLNQRAGRAGRHRPGEYYGVLGRNRADRLQPHQTVEMKRVDLSNIVMHVKALNFPGMSVEEVLAATIEPPEPRRVDAAMGALKMVGALDDKKDLTSLGRVLLQLPIDVQMGRLVLFGSFFRCLDQALTIAAILTSRDPFMSPMHLKEQAAARKNSFSPEEFRSDALAALRGFNKWWSMQSRGEYVSANRFCVDNFLSKPTLLMIAKLKSHILQSLYDVGVIEVSAGGITAHRPSRKAELTVPDQLNANGESLPMLAALITIALQPKFAIKTSDKAYRTSQDKAVLIHPSSVNNRRRDHDEHAKYEKVIIAYAEKRQNLSAGASAEHAQKFLVNTTRVDPLTYMLFGAHRVEVTHKGLDCDEWLPIVGDLNVLDDVERLKVMMESCMLRVFEGIIKLRNKRRVVTEGKEDESGDEDEDVPKETLSSTEIRELDLMTRDIVSTLNSYSSYRLRNQSRHNSRPATPMDSPFRSQNHLPNVGSGARSGYSTPRHMNNVAFSSRPGTPSRFSRK